MNSYTIFAKVYDMFMDDIPYDKWADQMEAFLAAANLEKCDILELGCGTGRFMELMAGRGHKVSGVDISGDMLKLAKRRLGKSGYCDNISLQDMRALECDRCYPVIISICDSMNYMENYFDLKSVMECVYNVLMPGGIFIFDMKTRSFYESLGDQVFVDERDAGYYIWENDYDSESRNNEYYLTFFIKDRKDLYKKYTEEHVQHAFDSDEVEKAAAEAGLEVTAILGMDMMSDADYNAERVYYVLERKE